MKLCKSIVSSFVLGVRILGMILIVLEVVLIILDIIVIFYHFNN